MLDLERAKSIGKPKGILDSILFTVQKSEFAYSLNMCDSHYRGTYAEGLVGNRLIDCGFMVNFCGENLDYDLLINKTIRAEVKLATIQPAYGNKTKYIFHKIKPECFDVLFLVFLNPHGAVVKWTDSEMVDSWSVDYKRGDRGYTVTFDGDMNSSKLMYDDFGSFVKAYRREK